MAVKLWPAMITVLLAGASSGAAVQPRLVAPGVVSTDAPEFGTSIDPRTGRLYFNRIEPELGMFIWAADRAGSTWRSADRLSIADDRYDDVDPFVSRSGDRLYFASNRPRPGSASEAPRADDDLWYLKREGSGWSRPIYAGDAINSDASESSPSEDRAGHLYFSRRDGAKSQILSAARRGARFGNVHELKVQSGAGARFGTVAVSADGSTLVLAGGSGGPPQLWVARRERGKWGPVRLLDLAPSGAARFAPYLSGDGRTLYFTGERPVPGAARGQRDIYEVALGRR
jgi:hypothetical protein